MLKIITTCFFVSIILSTAAQNQKSMNKKSKQVILFVCEHGAARSTIAAAYFNKLTKEQGINYVAVFRGTEPDESLTPATVKGLTNDSFDISGWSPKIVAKQDIEEAYKIITFDCMLPFKKSTGVQIQQWNGIPPISESYTIARDMILEKVKKLIENLPRK